MFPIAFPRGSIEGRTLRSDDVAGVSDLYRPASGGPPLGGLAGHVRKDGRGVFGAHVVAYGLRSGQIVGGFSITDDGDYVINGLEPGTYVVRVEPLDDGDVESFFENTAARRRRLRRHVLLEARRGAAQRRGRGHRHHGAGPMTVARARILVIAAVVCAAALLAPRAAQLAAPRRYRQRRLVEGYDLGRQRATITGPQTPTGLPVTLFDSDATIQSGPGAVVRVGWRVFNGVYAEATGGLGMNAIETRVDNDIEQAPPITVSSTLTQITIEGGALVELLTLRVLDGKLVPFIDGGGGYLRQMHEERVLIQNRADALCGRRREVALGGGAAARHRAAARGASGRALRVTDGRRRHRRRATPLHYRQRRGGHPAVLMHSWSAG